jgi:hypothetical protein
MKIAYLSKWRDDWALRVSATEPRLIGCTSGNGKILTFRG